MQPPVTYRLQKAIWMYLQFASYRQREKCKNCRQYLFRSIRLLDFRKARGSGGGGGGTTGWSPEDLALDVLAKTSAIEHIGDQVLLVGWLVGYWWIYDNQTCKTLQASFYILHDADGMVYWSNFSLGHLVFYRLQSALAVFLLGFEANEAVTNKNLH